MMDLAGPVHFHQITSTLEAVTPVSLARAEAEIGEKGASSAKRRVQAIRMDEDEESSNPSESMDEVSGPKSRKSSSADKSSFNNLATANRASEVERPVRAVTPIRRARNSSLIKSSMGIGEEEEEPQRPSSVNYGLSSGMPSNNRVRSPLRRTSISGGTVGIGTIDERQIPMQQAGYVAPQTPIQRRMTLALIKDGETLDIPHPMPVKNNDFGNGAIARQPMIRTAFPNPEVLAHARLLARNPNADVTAMVAAYDPYPLLWPGPGDVLKERDEMGRPSKDQWAFDGAPRFMPTSKSKLGPGVYDPKKPHGHVPNAANVVFKEGSPSYEKSRLEMIGSILERAAVERPHVKGGSDMEITQMAEAPPPLVVLLPLGLVDEYVLLDRFVMYTAVQLALKDAISDGVLKEDDIQLSVVNGWDPSYDSNDLASTFDSGGYGAVSLYDALSTTNSVGIIGDYFSRTTRFTAGVASQLKVPFCGATQGSTLLSNKKNFAYFFRSGRGKGSGKHYVRVMKNYGAKRLCVFAGKDPLSVSDRAHAPAVTTEIVEAMQPDAETGGGAVVFPIGDSSSYDRIYENAKRLQCRFFLISALVEETEPFFKQVLKDGFIQNDQVWASVNTVSLQAIENPQDFYGIFLFTPQFQENQTTSFDFISRFWALGKTIPNMDEIAPSLNITEQELLYEGLELAFMRETYICARAMLSGLSKTKNQLGLQSFRDISNYGSLLNYSAFMHTGYVDLWQNKVEFNEYGDRVFGYQAICTNETNLRNALNADPIGFGYTDTQATNFTELFPPVFRNGLTTPPKEVFDLDSSLYVRDGYPGAITARVLQAIGALAILFILGGLVLRRRILHGSYILFLSTISGASILSIASTLPLYGRQTKTICTVATYLFLTSVSSTAATLAYFVLLSRYCEKNKRVLLGAMNWRNVMCACAAMLLFASFLVSFLSNRKSDTLQTCSLLYPHGHVLRNAFAGIIFLSGDIRNGWEINAIAKFSPTIFIAVIILDLFSKESDVRNLIQSICLSCMPIGLLAITARSLADSKPARTPLPPSTFQTRFTTTLLNIASVSFHRSVGWSVEKRACVLYSDRMGLPRISLVPAEHPDAIDEIIVRGIRPHTVLTADDKEFGDEISGDFARDKVESAESGAESVMQALVLLSIPHRCRMLFRLKDKKERELFAQKLKHMAGKAELGDKDSVAI
ncbi:hypothetical protein HDU96_002535 [Phlyctochytrium bullatum]|nr:hypothetical protein HDU96_002535 [Phlyctochytrium bullatum]